MSNANTNDLIGLGAITIWIILCAGTPDLPDAIGDRVSGRNVCQVEVIK